MMFSSSDNQQNNNGGGGGGMSIEDKRAWIADKLEEMFRSSTKFELVAIDFEINLMVCAAQSYKHETALRPFPSTFLSDSNNDKNPKQLLSALKSLPPICEWKSKLSKFNSDQLAVIYWILIHKSFQLQYTTDVDEQKLRQMSKYTEPFTKPNHVFEVKYSEEKTKKFESIKRQASESLGISESELTSFAFHGTRMDNIHSILHVGLLSHLSKNALFGTGTYLSQEPSMCLHYSPGCTTWSESLLGQRMSCILVCETINDPQHVKVGLNENSSDSNNNRMMKTNKVPDRYFVVKNNEYVRVRYVLVYAEKSKQKKKNKLVQLISENRFVLMLICYALLLLFIGLMNSRTFHKYIKSSYKLLSNYLLGEATASIE